MSWFRRHGGGFRRAAFAGARAGCRVLVDRHGAAGLETSFGNAGLIERASLFPYLFPRDPKNSLLYALNLLPEAHYHLSALPGVAPWLWRYFLGARRTARGRKNCDATRPLIERCLLEHEVADRRSDRRGRPVAQAPAGSSCTAPLGRWPAWGAAEAEKPTRLGSEHRGRWTP